ncbi:hypothetical protein ALO_04116 [Acetonema longum DSM 6540]|uniref:Uncharacterized protein n=1 Tax=Acetonema longum DSM 6540 TaxID=1009370 RepID=F7NFJ6_9FIRM|nr:hypothetical protein ALO_04116 [Acetonema longum DSM 6540]
MTLSDMRIYAAWRPGNILARYVQLIYNDRYQLKWGEMPVGQVT